MSNFDAIVMQYLEKVEKQLRENRPAETVQTFQRLRKMGYPELEAKMLIAQCVAQEMYLMMESDQPYNEARYIASLHQLPDSPGR